MVVTTCFRLGGLHQQCCKVALLIVFKNTSEKLCYSLEGGENVRKELAHICTGWSTCSHSLTAALYCLKILKEKSTEKDKCLEKSLCSLNGKQAMSPYVIAHISPYEWNQLPSPLVHSSPWLTSYPQLQSGGWLIEDERKKESIGFIYLVCQVLVLAL